MSQPGKKAETKTEKAPRRRSEPVVVADPASEWTWLARFGGGPLATAGDGTIDGQAARLADPRLFTVQRQAIAAEIGHEQGNRHLHRVVGQTKEPYAVSLSTPVRSRPGHRVGTVAVVQRQHGSVTVGAGAETPQEGHGELAAEVLRLLEGDPNMSVRQALLTAVGTELEGASPTMAQSGELAAPSEEDLGARRASIIANIHYHPHDEDLDRAADSAVGMQGQLSARGYQTALHYDLPRETMMGAWLDPLDVSMPGDKVVLFFHGHGTTQGLKDVQGRFFGMDRFGVLRERALNRWVDLTIILQACHTGSVTDYFRRQEIQSLRQHLSHLPNTEAARELLDMAEDLQRLKDQISALESRKQAMLVDMPREAYEADPNIALRLSDQANALNPQIQALWEEALIRLEQVQARVLAMTGVTLALPAFPDGHWGTDFWTNPEQLDVMSTVINRVLELARGGA